MDFSVPTIILTSLLTTGLNLGLCSYLFDKKEKRFAQFVEIVKKDIIVGFPKPCVPSVPVSASQPSVGDIRNAVAETLTTHFAELLPKIKTEITDKLAATPETPDIAGIITASFSEISDNLNAAISDGLTNLAPKLQATTAYAVCAKCGHRVARFVRKDDGSIECVNCLNGSF